MRIAERVRYEHRQTGWPILLAAPVPLLCLLVIWKAAPEPTRSVPGGLVLLLCALTALMVGVSWLTVRVDDAYVVARFGVGLYRRAIAVADIVAVSPATTRWYEGWGIRVTGDGMLYNVGGFEAVRLRLADGRTVRIGSDEPERLCAAIRRAVEAARAAG